MVEKTHTFKLTIDDLTQYDTIANTLFNMNNVINIDTTFYRRDFSQIESDLQTAACADAKNKAVALAAGFGGEVGDVYCISQDGFDGIFETFMFNTANSGYSPAGVWGDFMAKDNSQPTLTSSPLNPRGATKPNFLA